MAKNDNLTDFLTDVANAIREKKGTTELINPQNFSDEIASIESGGGSRWTGHADVEGLKAIGWTDEDIQYYQENGVNWNEEDDEFHKVTEDNKALYGVLTINNISTYRDRIVYLPKIDISKGVSMSSKFSNCYSLVAIPFLNTSGVTSMRFLFRYCYSLVCVPPLDTSSVTDMNNMFAACYSLQNIPPLDTSKVTDMGSIFSSCRSLQNIPPLDMSSVTQASLMVGGCESLVNVPLLDTSKVTNINELFYDCFALVSVPLLDASIATSVSSVFNNCRSLVVVNIKGLQKSISLSQSALLSKESLLYMITNEAATSAITITLASYAYTRLAEDADILEALTNHPNITLAK